MPYLLLFILFSFFPGPPALEPSLVVLGITQDAGYPQANCQQACCQAFWQGQAPKRLITCLALLDAESDQRWLFEATPDFPAQLKALDEYTGPADPALNGIFLTHAHIGHYTGLMHLGREAMGANQVPVYAMPRMKDFLKNNGPWSQLVALENIQIQSLTADSTVQLNEHLQVRPILVPHRDEFSETVGFFIKGPQKTALFIPDIDKWSKWEQDLRTLLTSVDYALLDGTFYQNGELPNRDMSEIPHPFVVETIRLLQDLPLSERQKVIFIHFNHTNPLLREGAAKKKVEQLGFQVAVEGMRLPL